MKYKKGDIVISKKTGEEDMVVSVPGMKEYDSKSFVSADKGFLLLDNDWELQENWVLKTNKTMDEKTAYKEGDIVIAKHNAPYTFTGAGTVCIVKEVKTNNMLYVKPYNPFEKKEIQLPGTKTDENMEVDAQFFMPFFSQTSPDASTEKKWGKLGVLLIKAVVIIKKLLDMLLNKKVTDKEKQEAKKEVELFFEEVKKELSDEEKNNSGTSDAQEQKKQESDNGDGNMESGQDNMTQGEQKQPENSANKTMQALMQAIAETHQLAQSANYASAAKGLVGSSGTANFVQDESQPQGKVYCGVCKKHHTVGTHD